MSNIRCTKCDRTMVPAVSSPHLTETQTNTWTCPTCGNQVTVSLKDKPQTRTAFRTTVKGDDE